MKTQEQLLEQLKKYENKWVALKEGKEIVASGEDALQAKREAEKKGFKDAVLFKVMQFSSGYAPYFA